MLQIVISLFNMEAMAQLASELVADAGLAKEEIDFVAQLLGQLKAEGLKGFLPAAMDGWTREDQETQNAAAFGGGQMVARTRRGFIKLKLPRVSTHLNS